MKMPEWLARILKLEKTASDINANLSNINDDLSDINDDLSDINNDLSTHKGQAEIHRTIHVSTQAPTSADGKDGDIWIQYKA